MSYTLLRTGPGSTKNTEMLMEIRHSQELHPSYKGDHDGQTLTSQHVHHLPGNKEKAQTGG